MKTHKQNPPKKIGSPVFLRSGIRSHRQQDLHGHGDTGYLCHGVGHGAGGSSQGKQVGDAVHHSTHEEHQEVEAGHGQRGSNCGVDGSQEEKGEDVLHVVQMSPGGPRREKKEVFSHGWYTSASRDDSAVMQTHSLKFLSSLDEPFVLQTLTFIFSTQLKKKESGCATLGLCNVT